MKSKDEVIKNLRETRWRKHSREVLNHFPEKIKEVISKKKIEDEKSYMIKQSMFLHGDVGVGKTIAGCTMIFRYVYEAVISGRFFPKITYLYLSSSELYFKLKQAYANKDNSDVALLEQCRNVEILFLDDIATKVMTDWAYDIMYGIIDYRYLNNKLTILTSNITLNGLREYFNDDRIVRRIEDSYSIGKKKHWKLVNWKKIHNGKDN